MIFFSPLKSKQFSTLSILHPETLISEAEKPRHFIRLLSKLLLVVLLL